MSYDGRLMRQALARFDEDKQRRAENFRARERAVYTKCPRIEEIDRELSHTMAKIIASGLRRGTDPRPAIEALREENLNLQQEKRLLLTRLGLPGDYLEEKPKCSRCNDTGFLGSEVCSCLRGYYAREQNKELSGLLDLGSQCFENFNFDYYSSVPDEDLGVSPRTNMERVYDICQDYAHEFSPKSGNLLLTGGTGLGKTFLSASIARVVSASGHSVVYDTAGHIFARFEAQKFGRDDGREPRARLRPADFRRPRHRTDDELCPQRDVSDRQHAPHHGEEDRHLHEPEPRRARAALRRAGAVKIAGRVSNAALFRRRYPPAEEKVNTKCKKRLRRILCGAFFLAFYGLWITATAQGTRPGQ